MTYPRHEMSSYYGIWLPGDVAEEFLSAFVKDVPGVWTDVMDVASTVTRDGEFACRVRRVDGEMLGLLLFCQKFTLDDARGTDEFVSRVMDRYGKWLPDGFDARESVVLFDA